MKYNVITTEDGYQIQYPNGSVGRSVYHNQADAQTQVDIWNGPLIEEKYTPPIKMDERAYGINDDAYINDSNEEGEP